MFLDYKQPFALWNWLFGLLRAGQYQGKQVRVQGWFRRSPVPYVELNKLEVIDGSLPSRRCYSLLGKLIMTGVMIVVGVGLTVWGLLALVPA
jgi:hypothetical protein